MAIVPVIPGNHLTQPGIKINVDGGFVEATNETAGGVVIRDEKGHLIHCPGVSSCPVCRQKRLDRSYMAGLIKDCKELMSTMVDVRPIKVNRDQNRIAH